MREAITGFLIGETKEEKSERAINDYCKACRIARKDVDCRRCSKNIEVIDNGRK